MSLARFAEKWAWADDPPDRVSEQDLHSVEQQLLVRLPEDYRQAVLEFGLPRTTIALLDAIVERELDLHSLGELYSPTEIIEETLAWREIGMPGHLIAFASDCCGNMFCFDANQLRNGSANNKAIWFFDHDFETVEEIAPSFEAWVNNFCDVEPWPQTESN